MTDAGGMVQVLVPAAVQAPLRAWLDSRGLYLYPIPVEHDLPTYGVGFKDAAPEEAGRRPGGG